MGRGLSKDYFITVYSLAHICRKCFSWLTGLLEYYLCVCVWFLQRDNRSANKRKKKSLAPKKRKRADGWIELHIQHTQGEQLLVHICIIKKSNNAITAQSNLCAVSVLRCSSNPPRGLLLFSPECRRVLLFFWSKVIWKYAPILRFRNTNILVLSSSSSSHPIPFWNRIQGAVLFYFIYWRPKGLNSLLKKRRTWQQQQQQ